MFRYGISGRGLVICILLCAVLVIGSLSYRWSVQRSADEEFAPAQQRNAPQEQIDTVEQIPVSMETVQQEADVPLDSSEVSDSEIESMASERAVAAAADLPTHNGTSDVPQEMEVPESVDFKTTPDGYPLRPYWDHPMERQQHWTHDHKLIDHVLVKLWRQGVRNFEGGSIEDTGRVRPHYTNTLYVEWDVMIGDDGTERPYISHCLGPAGLWLPEDIFDVPPPSVNLIDMNSPEGQGIDPYTFLTSTELP